MYIEDEIFKRCMPDENKLILYGFIKNGATFSYTKNILNDDFRVDIEVKNGTVRGKIFDKTIDEEYTTFRNEKSVGAFVGTVRTEFRAVLEDIRKKCFKIENFIYRQTNYLCQKIEEIYGDAPEFEWDKFPGFAIFRNKSTRKWYAIIMNINKGKLDKTSDCEVEIMNIKLDPTEIEKLLKKDGFYPAYHMNKKNWITIILDDTVDASEILALINKSYAFSKK